MFVADEDPPSGDSPIHRVVSMTAAAGDNSASGKNIPENNSVNAVFDSMPGAASSFRQSRRGTTSGSGMQLLVHTDSRTGKRISLVIRIPLFVGNYRT